LDGDVIAAVEVKEPDGHTTTFDEGNLDPLRLPHQLRQWSRRMAEAKKGDERIVTLKVRRHQAFAEGPERRRLVNVPLRWESSWENQYDEPLSRTSPAAIPELGIAYQVRSKIVGVDNGQGLQTGDIISALESSNPKTGVAVDPDGWAWAFAALQRMQNKDITMEVLRDGQRVKLALNGMEDATWPLEDRGLLLAQDTRIQKSDNLLDALGLGLAQLRQEISQVVANVRNLLVGSIAPENLGGPTAVAQVGYRIAEFDLFSFIGFMGIMSLNFSLFNLWPIPLLDGGEALLLLVEKAKGSPLPPVARFIAYTIGLLLLSSCFLANLALDLMR
jgi:RIP metalloprotease RseP